MKWENLCCVCRGRLDGIEWNAIVGGGMEWNAMAGMDMEWNGINKF